MRDVTRLWIGGLVLGAVSLFHVGMAITAPAGTPVLMRAMTFALLSIAAFLGDIGYRSTAAR